MFIRDSRTKPKDVHAIAVKFMLEKYNRTPNMSFKWHAKTRTLDLSGNVQLSTVHAAQTSFTPRINLLDGLPVLKIILDDTPQNRKNGLSFRPDKVCTVEFKPLEKATK